MVQSSELQNEIVEALQNPPELDFDLPNPEDEALPEFEFLQQVDRAWLVCDRFDLQTDIWRGRILRAVRDREKIGGEGRGKGFLKWLRDRDISKSQAYSLIELANSADTLLEEGKLNPDAINNFSKRAFVETAHSPVEVQQLVASAAQDGDRITRREVKQLSDEWTAMTSELLPEEVREKAADRSLPARHVAPLVRELEKLPENYQQEIQREVSENPDVDSIKQLTSDARNLSKYIDAAAQVQTLRESSLDLEMALEEALRVGCLNVASDLVKQAAQLEQTVTKLYATWKRLADRADRLYVDTGASTPHLRSLVTCIERITGQVIEVPLDESGENTVRLQILSD
ncbi:hypothetical protein AY599_22345 [Leptolyngbya valderiana BDU 20041]|nr:hypothetical protein [Geitlerinema sp. CS-897]OAB61594.1 hypothetical protein AY599_22345 [Leptolyngbya valderiana BDU 20041]PPT08862.1 hypothetical protein CKA32_004951 [Geitlerinema sp. FC II]